MLLKVITKIIQNHPICDDVFDVPVKKIHSVRQFHNTFYFYEKFDLLFILFLMWLVLHLPRKVYILSFLIKVRKLSFIIFKMFLHI